MSVIDPNGAVALQRRLRLKREYGEAYPTGTETVAAPATVSGEWACTMPLAISREGAGQQRPASQETCHLDVQPQRTGCSDGSDKTSGPPRGVAIRSLFRRSGPRRGTPDVRSTDAVSCMSCDGHGASLEVRGLSYGPTGARSLIKNIDFTLTAGERLAILGPNGAGKTTLLRCLYRAVRPGEGRVLLDGQDVWTIDPRTVARRIAVVVQEMPADFPFTVEDIVMMGRIPWQKRAWKRSQSTGDDKARALHAMDHLHVTDLARRDFATLSGGEKQRVLVARALAQDPQLLILDEPSNHLDIRNQLEILDLLRGLGITIVTTLHDINLAAGFATRAIILKDGQMIAEGCPRDVLTADHLSAAFTVQTHVHSPDGGATRNFSFALSA